MSSEQTPADDPSIKWTTYSGGSAEGIATLDDFPLSGRAMGKQLHISDRKERDSYDRCRDSVTAAVHLLSPGPRGQTDRIIGTFTSKPIKIVSKPKRKVRTIRKSGRKDGFHLQWIRTN